MEMPPDYLTIRHHHPSGSQISEGSIVGVLHIGKHPVNRLLLLGVELRSRLSQTEIEHNRVAFFLDGYLIRSRSGIISHGEVHRVSEITWQTGLWRYGSAVGGLDIRNQGLDIRSNRYRDGDGMSHLVDDTHVELVEREERA